MALRVGVALFSTWQAVYQHPLAPTQWMSEETLSVTTKNASRCFQMFRSQGVGVRSGGSLPDELHQYKPSERIYGAKAIVNFGAAENYIESFANSLFWSYIKSTLFKNPAPEESCFSSKTHLFSRKPCFPHQQITKSCNLSFTSSSFLISLPLAHYLSTVQKYIVTDILFPFKAPNNSFSNFVSYSQ